MELDNEVKGNGNSYTTEFRQYDPRLGRWLSLDPLMMKFPSMSPYCAFDNNPVYYVDPYGLESGTGQGHSMEGEPLKTESGSECDDGKQNQPTPLGEIPKEDELKNYSYDSDKNKWNTSNDWRLKADKNFADKLNAVSNQAEKVTSNLCNNYNYKSSNSQKDITFSYTEDEGAKSTFNLEMTFKTSQGNDIHPQVPVAYYIPKDKETKAKIKIISDIDMKNLYTNCFADVLGLIGYISWNDFAKVLSDDFTEVKDFKNNIRKGDVVVFFGDHAMVCIGFKDGKPIYRSNWLNDEYQIGTFDELKMNQFEFKGFYPSSNSIKVFRKK